jgi:uncharacterized protein (DUF58 family)
MVQAQPRKETGIGSVLHGVCGRIRRRGLVIVISDLFAPLNELVNALAHFHHRRHEVILLQVLDPDEYTFPFSHVAEFQCIERDGRRLRLDASRVRGMYLERFERFERELRGACHRFRYDHVMLSTDKPFDAALSHYLRHRRGC